MEQNELPTSSPTPAPPEKTPQTSDATVFFPAIAKTSEEENRAIEQMIADAEAKRNAPQVAYYDEEEDVSVPESAPLPAEPKAPQTEPKAKQPRIRFKEIPPFIGIFQNLKDKYRDQPGKRKALSALVGTLTGIVLLAALAVMAFIYAVCTAAVLLGALFLLLLCVALVAAGLAGLTYGIVLLFTHGVLVALVEIGLALMLFGIILALSALAGELATNQLMKLVRFLTRLFVYCILYLLSFVFGKGRIFKDDARSEKEVQRA